MKKNVSIKGIEEIKKEVMKEFPYNSPMQEIHIARNIIAKEKQNNNFPYFEYIKFLKNQIKT